MYPSGSLNTTPTSEFQLASVYFMSSRQHGQLEGLWALVALTDVDYAPFGL